MTDGRVRGTSEKIGRPVMAKRSDSESQRREAQLRATLYSIGDAVIATDRSGCVEMMNPVAERLTGWSEAEAVGKPLETIFHIINEETRQPVENPVARVLREGVVVGLANHTLLIARDGREYAIADAGSPIFDADGKITGVVLVFRDQTAERTAQRTLQEARRFAESIVETLREPLLVLDEKLEVVSANRSFYRLFRVRPEETIGKKVYELGNGQWNIARLRALLEDILPSNTHFDDFEVEHTFEHIGRRNMVLNARRLLRSEGTAEFILLAFEDVTDRWKAERALQESEERHRHISEIISDYAYSFLVLEDGTLRGEWVTDSFRHTFGYTLQEVQSMGGWQKMVHPDDLPAALDHVRKLLQGERDICEMRFVTRTGEARWLRDYAIPVWDQAHRRIVRIYGASQDITEQRRAQTALLMSEERHRYISELISDYAYAFRVESTGRLVREWVTDSFTQITGYTPLEIDQRGGLQSLISPDDLPVAHKRLERLLAGEKDVSEFRIIRKDGAVRWLRDHATPALDPLLQRVVRIYGAAQDITERKRAEEALQLSHKRYEQLVNSIDGIVWEADAETFHFHFVSKQAERLLGYPVEEWVSQPTFWKDHIHPEDVTWAIEYCTQATKELRAHEFEYRMIAADGRIVWLRDNVVVIPKEGKPHLLRGIMVDITRHKRTERILADYTRVLELVTTGAPLHLTLETLTRQIEAQAPGMFASVLLLDRDGVHLRHGAAPSLPEEYNKQVDGLVIGEGVGSCGTAAWRRKQVIVQDIATDPLWANYREIVDRFGLRACWSTPILDHDGNVLGTFALYYNRPAAPTPEHFEIIQRATHLAAIVLERHRREEALRESEERYRTLYQENPSMFFTLDAAGTIVSVNTFGAQYLGYEIDELLGKTSLMVFHQEDHDVIMQHLQQCLQSPGRAFHTQVRKVRKDGSVFWVEEYGRAVPNPTGGHHVLIVCTDITERKRAEEQRLRLEQHLQQAQKLESLGTLASGVAHDFNNILGIILGHSSALEQYLSGSEQAGRHLEAISKASQRGASLVRQLLTFARKTESVLLPLDINDIVIEVTRLLNETFPKSITIVTDLQPGLPVITADATQLHQVVVNLSVNARDAMPKGGTLTLRTRRVSSSEVIARHPQAPMREHVLLEVSDTGIGMDQETLRRVFEPFFTTKEIGKGTGLGLALVHGIVETHGGFIDVESIPQQGTTFRLVIPVAEQQPSTSRPASLDVQAIPGGSETLLIIEDEEMLRDLLQTLLESKGYRVLTAEDGNKGVELYRAHREGIDAVITDMGLPLLSGEEVFRSIRSINPQAKIILASGYLEPEVKADLMGQGANEFIQKPYTMSEILLKTRRVLDSQT